MNFYKHKTTLQRVRNCLKKAELDTKELIAKNGKKIEISPGMSATIDIITGEKTVFDYMTKPIVKTLSESFQER